MIIAGNRKLTGAAVGQRISSGSALGLSLSWMCRVGFRQDKLLWFGNGVQCRAVPCQHVLGCGPKCDSLNHHRLALHVTPAFPYQIQRLQRPHRRIDKGGLVTRELPKHVVIAAIKDKSLAYVSRPFFFYGRSFWEYNLTIVHDYVSLARPQDCGLKGGQAAEAPEDAREALHQLALQTRLRVVLLHELGPKLIKIIGALTDDNEHLPREAVLPCIKAERALPPWLLGPVLLFALALFASSCVIDAIIQSPVTHEFLFGNIVSTFNHKATPHLQASHQRGE